MVHLFLPKIQHHHTLGSSSSHCPVDTGRGPAESHISAGNSSLPSYLSSKAITGSLMYLIKIICLKILGYPPQTDFKSRLFCTLLVFGHLGPFEFLLVQQVALYQHVKSSEQMVKFKSLPFLETLNSWPCIWSQGVNYMHFQRTCIARLIAFRLAPKKFYNQYILKR